MSHPTQNAFWGFSCHQLAVGGLGGGALALVQGGGGSSFTSFTSSSPSQSPPTIAALTPSSSAHVYPTCPILAHFPAVYCLEATQTTEQTLACSQSLKAFRIVNPLAGSVASKRCRLPNCSLCAWSRSRQRCKHRPHIPSVDNDIHDRLK